MSLLTPDRYRILSEKPKYLSQELSQEQLSIRRLLDYWNGLSQVGEIKLFPLLAIQLLIKLAETKLHSDNFETITDLICEVIEDISLSRHHKSSNHYSRNAEQLVLPLYHHLHYSDNNR